jgi:hypothetical protein
MEKTHMCHRCRNLETGGRAATTMNTYGIPAVTAKPTTTEHKYMFV